MGRFIFRFFAQWANVGWLGLGYMVAAVTYPVLIPLLLMHEAAKDRLPHFYRNYPAEIRIGRISFDVGIKAHWSPLSKWGVIVVKYAGLSSSKASSNLHNSGG